MQETPVMVEDEDGCIEAAVAMPLPSLPPRLSSSTSAAASSSSPSPSSGNLSQPGLPTLPAAVLCHPWGRLGGCMDDHVILSVRNALIDQGFLVCRFNFRGVGNSSGSGSFTGVSERKNVLRVCKFLLEGAPIAGRKLANVEKIVLVGYSYGSVIACSVVDKMEEIVGAVAISYPLRYAWALVCWKASKYWEKFACSEKSKLFLYGTEDDFTGKDQLHSAFKKLKHPAQEGCFEGVNHFWIRERQQLTKRISEWARDLVN
eukprot:766749-Hanusia_phi.AAC.4